VVNRGTITVKEGGLVALVAPGVAQRRRDHRAARQGQPGGRANRFTVDFHGDRLIQFAVDDKVMSQADRRRRHETRRGGVETAAASPPNGGVVQMTPTSPAAWSTARST